MAKLLIKFCVALESTEDWENNISNMIIDFEKQTYQKMHHIIYFL
jgi:hypothetical protein